MFKRLPIYELLKMNLVFVYKSVVKFPESAISISTTQNGYIFLIRQNRVKQCFSSSQKPTVKTPVRVKNQPFILLSSTSQKIL